MHIVGWVVMACLLAGSGAAMAQARPPGPAPAPATSAARAQAAWLARQMQAARKSDDIMRDAITQARHELAEGVEVAVTCSIGAVEYPSVTDDWEELIALADTAQYLVKKSGRNGWALLRFADQAYSSLTYAHGLALRDPALHGTAEGQVLGLWTDADVALQSVTALGGL